ncbi:hypothetical protein CANCADRAFT_11696, partial [Tortispora caseinolytica NRRL Y-17796]
MFTLGCLISELTLIFIALTVFSYSQSLNDRNACQMSYMSPSFARFTAFDTTHTKHASKYSLYLYREQRLDDSLEPNGVPVLFIPGNAGSYKQVRAIAAEAAEQYYLGADPSYSQLYGLNTNFTHSSSKSPIDFFTADFNEDFTAFHGRALLDQAEYLNDAVEFILSLYNSTDPHRPAPQSVILLGHSMGGIVARTMLTLMNYRENSVNTLLTLSAPHVISPSTHDWDIVNIYNRVNKYWRDSYSFDLVGRNPLASVALVSVAGGNLDSIVPSDYATVSSLVPPSNGLTVFTSTMPGVWTNMDHQAIIWCDQSRKSFANALLSIVDTSSPTMTLPLEQRMQIFRKLFLSGLEDYPEKHMAASKSPNILLKVSDVKDSIHPYSNPLQLHLFGKERTPKLHLLSIPPEVFHHGREVFFNLLTDRKIVSTQSLANALNERKGGGLHVSFCKYHASVAKAELSKDYVFDFHDSSEVATSLWCTSAEDDLILLPCSVHSEEQPPLERANAFSYLQYNVSQFRDYDFIAIIDGYQEVEKGFLMADLTDSLVSITRNNGWFSLATRKEIIELPDQGRSIVSFINFPKIRSSILSFKLKLIKTATGKSESAFAPLLRQYIADPYESLFYPNFEEVTVSFHGSSPFIPFWNSASHPNHLGLQLWIDPSSNAKYSVSIELDILSSLSNLVMLYRTILSVFPFAVLSTVMLLQLDIYHSRGVFISLGDAFNIAFSRVLPFALLFFSFMTPSTTGDDTLPRNMAYNLLISPIPINEMFLGLSDKSFWWLGPVLIVVCCGLTYMAYGLVNVVLYILAKVLSLLVRRRNVKLTEKQDVSRKSPSAKGRVIISVLLCLNVFSIVPYQLTYISAVFVLLGSRIRNIVFDDLLSPGSNRHNFNNFSHTILMFLLLGMPSSVLIMVVWIKQLSINPFSQFSSSQSLLSILPIILLVDRVVSGQMVPRNSLGSQQAILSRVLLSYMAVYALIYGAMHAYWLHNMVNLFSLWLLLIYA